MEKDTVFYQILELIEEKIGKPDCSIEFNTELEDDLGITGHDAGEFILDFSKKFNIDISGFAFDKYFGPEGDEFLISIWNFLTRKKDIRTPLTVEQLHKAIKIGKLE